MSIFDKVIVLGTGKIASRCIETLVRHTNEVIGIEQEEQTLSSGKGVCRKHGLLYLFIPDKLELTAYLDAFRGKILVVSANNNYLFPRQIVEKDNLCIVNFHNSLLPSYPGRNAPTWVIYEQEQIAGITWHLVNEGVDTGDIIAQTSIPVGIEMTALELTRKCMEAGIVAFDGMIPRLLLGQIDYRKQVLLQRKNFHRSDEIPNGGYLDISWSGDKISAFLRSVDYGKLRVFPFPRVILQGYSYWIPKYKILPVPLSERAIWGKPERFMIESDGLQVQMELERGTDDE